MSGLSASWWNRRNSQRTAQDGELSQNRVGVSSESSSHVTGGTHPSDHIAAGHGGGHHIATGPGAGHHIAAGPGAAPRVPVVAPYSMQPSHLPVDQVQFPYQLPSQSAAHVAHDSSTQASHAAHYQPQHQPQHQPQQHSQHQHQPPRPHQQFAPFPYATSMGVHEPAQSPAWSANTGIDFGPIHHLMTDPTVEEIWINSPQKVFISRHGKTELTSVLLTSDLVENLVERALMWGGRRLDRSHPFVDARLPDGSRLHVAIPDVTAEHWAINIRKHLMHGKTLQDLSNIGVFNEEVLDLLSMAVKERKNILVSGSTQAGKTTLLNALIAEVPHYERVITIEEVFEIRSVLPDVVSMQTRSASLEGTGEITLRDLIKESLRMRPSRLVVGEIREAESLDLLIALNSGIPGMATIHGNSARDAVRKLQTLPLLAGENISFEFSTPTVARSIDWVVHVGIDPLTGVRKLREICELSGRLEGQTLEIEQIYQLEKPS